MCIDKLVSAGCGVKASGRLHIDISKETQDVSLFTHSKLNECIPLLSYIRVDLQSLRDTILSKIWSNIIIALYIL